MRYGYALTLGAGIVLGAILPTWLLLVAVLVAAVGAYALMRVGRTHARV